MAGDNHSNRMIPKSPTMHKWLSKEIASLTRGGRGGMAAHEESTGHALVARRTNMELWSENSVKTIFNPIAPTTRRT